MRILIDHPDARARMQVEALVRASFPEARVEALEPGFQDASLREQQHLGLMDLSADALFVHSAGVLLHVNPAGQRMLAADAARLVGTTLLEHFHPQDRARATALHAQLPNPLPYVELRLLRADGTTLQVEVSALPYVLRGKEGALTIARDITRRKQAEDAVRMYEDVVRGMQLGVYIYALERPGDPSSLRMVATNEAAERFTGVPADKILGRLLPEIFPALMQSELPQHFLEVIESGRVRDIGEMPYSDGRVDGIFTVRLFPLPGHCVCVAFENITARKGTEQALRESEERFRLIARAASDSVWDWDIPSGMVWWNDTYGRLVRSREESVVLPLEEWAQRLHPDDHDKIVGGLERLFADGGQSWSAEYRFRLGDGTYALVHDHGHVLRDAGGRAVRMVGAMRDVTRERALQEQLQQSQKMDAVGRLAGGIAHDFNNLLTAILGYSELALDRLPADAPLRGDIEQIQRAGERAASLTRQLLAFSRKQPVVPRPIALGEVIGGLADMLRRLIPEDIELATHIAPGTPPVRADQGQLEQVLINLVLNARDAMPRGGKLEVRAGPATAGPDGSARVRIEVQDQGLGMSEEVKLRVFEPFFTTKKSGTGLGLSTVYGIVQQMGGEISVESEPGAGALFSVLLPAWLEEQAPTGTPPRAIPVGHHERVLLVEDEDAVRSLTCEVLQRVGYRVHPAAQPEQALQILRGSQEEFDLLLTDVAMPGASGEVLAEVVRRLSPRTRVLFMSAHVGDKVARRGRGGPERALLRKPFSAEALLQAVRAALDTPNGE